MCVSTPPHLLVSPRSPRFVPVEPVTQLLSLRARLSQDSFQRRHPIFHSHQEAVNQPTTKAPLPCEIIIHFLVLHGLTWIDAHVSQVSQHDCATKAHNENNKERVHFAKMWTERGDRKSKKTRNMDGGQGRREGGSRTDVLD